MKLFDQAMTLERLLLYITIICLLFAQYVVNDKPGDQIFRLLGLLAFAGVICILGVRILSKG